MHLYDSSVYEYICKNVFVYVCIWVNNKGNDGVGMQCLCIYMILLYMSIYVRMYLCIWVTNIGNDGVGIQ